MEVDLTHVNGSMSNYSSCEQIEPTLIHLYGYEQLHGRCIGRLIGTFRFAKLDQPPYEQPAVYLPLIDECGGNRSITEWNSRILRARGLYLQFLSREKGIRNKRRSERRAWKGGDRYLDLSRRLMVKKDIGDIQVVRHP